MLLFLETSALCLLFWLICYSGTGTDEKNIKSYRSYPKAVQKMLDEDERFKGKITKSSPAAVFLSNVVLFSVVLFLAGIPLRQESILYNFLNILIMGEILNAFDYFIMDLLWFRNTKRTRFEGTREDDALYRNPENHRAAFIRGIAAFAVVALIDGVLLSLF